PDTWLSFRMLRGGNPGGVRTGDPDASFSGTKTVYVIENVPVRLPQSRTSVPPGVVVLGVWVSVQPAVLVNATNCSDGGSVSVTVMSLTVCALATSTSMVTGMG